MKKILPFREWKKLKKRKMIRKGIDITKITEHKWRCRYNNAKSKMGHECSMKDKKRPPEIVEKCTMAIRKFWASPKGKKLAKEKGKKTGKALLGRKQSPEHIEKCRLTRIGKKQRPEVVEARRLKAIGRPCPWNRGNKNCMHRPEVKIKVNTKKRREKMRQWTINKMKEGGYNMKPNYSESFLMDILNQIYPNQWKFTGDGKLWINCQNPDFMHKRYKKIIELFGDFWHTERDKRTPQYRKSKYKKVGYKCLIIWDKKDRLWSHPENIANKIISWIGN